MSLIHLTSAGDELSWDLLSMLGKSRGYGCRWSRAHATFYGGGDASGTMHEMRI